MIRHMRFLLCTAVIAGVGGTPGLALEIDCDEPTTQRDMNHCAALEYQAEDAKLNAVWKEAMTAMRDVDAGLDAEDRGAADVLLQAQRAWLEFRDAHCESIGIQYTGGSIRPLIHASCLAETTRLRTEQLMQISLEASQ